MNRNFEEKAIEAIKEIEEMNAYCEKEFNTDYVECFPAESTKKIEINGKSYLMKITISLREIG